MIAGLRLYVHDCVLMHVCILIEIFAPSNHAQQSKAYYCAWLLGSKFSFIATHIIYHSALQFSFSNEYAHDSFIVIILHFFTSFML